VDLAAGKEKLFRRLTAEIRDARVIEAMRQVPRERFVPAAQLGVAYEDRPLSIGYGQTISQPFIVAMMLEALELTGSDKVLEVGSGSGYVTAILSHLAARVVGVELVPELVESSTAVLAELGRDNATIHQATRASLGYLPDAPYDAILVSAGAPSVPQLLLAQLKWNGRLVIPAGSRWQQNLLQVTRRPEGDIVRNLGACYFVPLLGQNAWAA